MRKALLVAGLAVVVFAGCIGGSDSSTSSPASSSAANETTPGEDRRYVELHAFEGAVDGIVPPDPTGPGGLAGQGAAKTETFEVPANASNFGIEAEIPYGQGSARFTIVDESGETVYQTRTYTYVGQACGSSTGISPDEETTADLPLDPGTYEARYHVTGSACFDVTVSAKVAT